MKCPACDSGVTVLSPALAECEDSHVLLLGSEGIRELQPSDIPGLRTKDLKALRSSLESWFKPAAPRCPGCEEALSSEPDDLGVCPFCGEPSIEASGALEPLREDELKRMLGGAKQYVDLAGAVARALRDQK